MASRKLLRDTERLATLCDGPEGWDEAAVETEAQEMGGTCIFIADSRCCMVETNITLQSNYPPTKKKFIIRN